MNLNEAQLADRDDELAHFRSEFAFPVGPNGTPWVYLCGNSLGLMPLAVPSAVQVELDSWARYGVEGHFEGPHPWMPYHRRLTAPLARLMGALESEVVSAHTLTVNLHLLMAGFYRPQGQRTKILVEAGAFPSDQYAVDSQLKHHGIDPAEGLIEVDTATPRGLDPTTSIVDAIRSAGDQTAVVLLGAVQYYSGAFFDVPTVVREAHQVGALVGLDLAHAAGNVPLSLHEWGVDFACWCSYKYLNSGPGGPGGLFVHERHHHRRDLGRFEGWWGHDEKSRFEMPRHFVPAPGAEAWQLSNAQVMAMAPHAVALEIHDRAGMERLRIKSLRLTAMLEQILQEFLGQHPQLDGRLLTPALPERRGCQLSLNLRHRGREVFDHLHQHGILADWRNPDTIRLAPVPLYTSYTDLHRIQSVLQKFV